MIRRILGAGLLVLATMMVSPAAHASSDVLPLPDFGDLAVHDATRRVFITGAESANSVLVVDHSGRVLKRIDNQYGATGLVLSEDGKTLYVAQTTGDAISAISTQTFTETARYPTGAQTCPTHLTRTGGVVWFGYGCTDSWEGGIGRLDPTATPPVSLDEHGDALFQNAPLLTAAGTTLVTGELNNSLATTRVYEVAGDTLVPGAAGQVTGSNLTDVALSPDATTAYTAAGSRTFVQGFATTDLSGRGSYHTGPYPNAVATAADGTHVATGAYTSRADAITVYELGETVPVSSFRLSGLVLADRGLAWSADGKYLYAIVQAANDPRPRLEVINRPLD